MSIARILMSSSGDMPEITSSPELSGEVDSAYSYDVNATGTAPITYSLTTKPTGMTINSSTGVISWTPSSGQSGDNSVVVVARNNSGSSSQGFDIAVDEINEWITAGTFSWTVPSGVTSVSLCMIGAGSSPEVPLAGDAGGGQRGAIISPIASVTPGASVTVIVGGAVALSAGGDSTFGTITASGGALTPNFEDREYRTSCHGTARDGAIGIGSQNYYGGVAGFGNGGDGDETTGGNGLKGGGGGGSCGTPGIGGDGVVKISWTP